MRLIVSLGVLGLGLGLLGATLGSHAWEPRKIQPEICPREGGEGDTREPSGGGNGRHTRNQSPELGQAKPSQDGSDPATLIHACGAIGNGF